MTTAEIKSQALESIREEMGGASTISLIKMARRLYNQGKEYDDRGDLEAALSAYVKATSLVNEANRDESVVKNFQDIKPMVDDLLSRTKLVEDTLKATEMQTLREAGSGGFKAGIRPLLLPSMIPGLGGPPFGSQLPPVPANTNGLVKTMANMTTAEIKSHALESVQRGQEEHPPLTSSELLVGCMTEGRSTMIAAISRRR
ncbi:hypothetical protein F5146DRAFT_669208 [Armillaria mellea]|nr:hypothetical protein F5146DRAFT_669208 [Armillaria mellea]